MDHCRERMAAEQQRLFAGRIEAALSAELGDLKQRYQQAEARMRQELEARRREEAARLEAWRVSERERISAELATEEERFSERLQRQLKDFEWQLDERQREQEERIARWYEETGRLARQRVAAILDAALRPATSRVALSSALQPLDSNAVPHARAAGEQDGRSGAREVDGAPYGDAPPGRAGVHRRLGQFAIG